METDKIEPALLGEIARLRAAGQRGVRLPVIVSIAGLEGGRLRDAAALEVEVHRSQAPTRKRLADLGVTDVAPLTLANAIEVILTAEQIQSIAAEPTVKAIVWNRMEQVTAR
jgi:hypothetical protein